MRRTPSPPRRGQPRTRRSPASIEELYAVSGAGWWALAAAAAVLGLVQVATGDAVGAAALGVGRLHMTYVAAVVLGAAPMPAAGLLLAAAQDRAPATSGSWSRRGLWMWNAGLAAGLLAVILGRAGPLPWLAMPAWASAVVAAGMALWGAGLWRRKWPPRVAAWQWIAAPATLAGPVYLIVGGILVQRLGGSAQEAAAAAAARGLVGAWVFLLAAAAAAATLPGVAGRSLHGRRLLLAGLVGWLMTLPLAALAPAAPDLVPSWMTDPVMVATALAPLGALAMVMAVVGVWAGRRPAAAPPAWAVFVTLGLTAMAAAALADGALAGPARAAVRFTAWDPWSALFPPFLGAFLVAAGIGLRSISAWGRWPYAPHFALGFCALASLPLWLVGLARAAAGPAAAVGRAEAALRLPWALVTMAVAGVWLLRAARGPATPGATPWASAVADRPTAGLMAGLAIVTVSAGVLVGVFLPVADPGTVLSSPRTAARDLETGSVRARGRLAYQHEGCAVCHTQRVQAVEAFTRGMGPATARGDYPPTGPALAGASRIGPDLAWIGDRLPSRDAVAERMAVHSPAAAFGAGSVSFPWLIDPGPVGQGGAVIEYLAGLRSGPQQ